MEGASTDLSIKIEADADMLIEYPVCPLPPSDQYVCDDPQIKLDLADTEGSADDEQNLNIAEVQTVSMFDGKYCCNLCSDTTFATEKDLNEHLGTHYNAQTLTCELCRKSLKNTLYLMRHMRFHAQGPSVCPICSKRIFKKANLERHMQQHSGTAKRQCDVCHKVLSCDMSLARHMLGHADLKFKCDVCDKRLPHKASLDAHMAVHSERVKCEHCPQTFASKLSLLNHTHRRHPALEQCRYQCRFCPSRFAQPRFLKRHEQTHLDERAHVCDYCHKAFKRVEHLKRHLRLHTQERPFACCFCERQFTVKEKLKSHMFVKHIRGVTSLADLSLNLSSNDDVTSRECPFCKELYFNDDAFTAHLKSHFTATMITCDFCDKQFVNGSSCKAHMKRHTSVSKKRKVCRYNCANCGANFTTKLLLKKHIRLCRGDVNVAQTNSETAESKVCIKIKIEKSEPSVASDKQQIGEHKCNLCGKIFVREKALARHMACAHAADNKHTSDDKLSFQLDTNCSAGNSDKHECDFCDESFAWPNELEKHMYVHIM